MCVYIYIYIYTHIHQIFPTYTYVRKDTHAYTRIHIHTQARTHARAPHMYTHTSNSARPAKILGDNYANDNYVYQIYFVLR